VVARISQASRAGEHGGDALRRSPRPTPCSVGGWRRGFGEALAPWRNELSRLCAVKAADGGRQVYAVEMDWLIISVGLRSVSPHGGRPASGEVVAAPWELGPAAKSVRGCVSREGRSMASRRVTAPTTPASKVATRFIDHALAAPHLRSHSAVSAIGRGISHCGTPHCGSTGVHVIPAFPLLVVNNVLCGELPGALAYPLGSYR
jgi:hypothetical protein